MTADSPKPDALLEALQGMVEAQFTRTVVIPLMESLYPDSSVEETHGSSEAGRDVICRTDHPTLNRPYTICIQAKNHRISPGATTGPYSITSIANQLQTAKAVGVCGSDGATVRPDEVWFVSSFPFPEPRRREVQDILSRLKDINAHLIAGNEFASLLIRNRPDLAAQLSRWSNSRLAQAIASLSVHHESRAFGLRTDRLLDDFHVSARICPTATLANQLLSEAIEFVPHQVSVKWKTDGARADRLATRGTEIDPSDLERSQTLATFAPLVTAYKIPTAWRTHVARQSSVRLTRRYEFDLTAATGTQEEVLRATLGEKTDLLVSWICSSTDAVAEEQSGRGIMRPDVDRNPELARLLEKLSGSLRRLVRWSVATSDALDAQFDQCTVVRTYWFDLPGISKRIRASLRKSFRDLPAKVGTNPAAVSAVIRTVGELETFLATCRELGVTRRTAADLKPLASTVLLEDESHLMSLAPRLLVEGNPGFGKTTLLRRLAISRLKENKPVYYLPCSRIDIAKRGASLRDIAASLAPPETPKEWNRSDVPILVDGLDEAPFDLSECVMESTGPVIASVRKAFHTDLRKGFARIELGAFTEHDHQEFFSRWFSRDQEQRLRALSLIEKHADLRIHVSVPLLATLVAALVERGFAPTNRNEIYNNRLELLLGRWDHMRGVVRTRVPSDVKIRFLEHLAYLVHESPGRRTRFGRPELEQAFSEGVGFRGRNLSIDDVVDDLVLAAGVLVREGDEYSFGHLTFQEHLAARRLKILGRASKILMLLSSSWWREVLLFYAGEVGDITDIVDAYEQEGSPSLEGCRLLRTMIDHAQYTQHVAVEILEQRISELGMRADVERDDEAIYDGKAARRELMEEDVEIEDSDEDDDDMEDETS